MDVLKMATFASIHDCKKASSEVVKQDENPKIAGLIYPIMQALDEEYLNVDVQYGGLDQRKILMFAREYLPKVEYKQRIEFMTPLIPALTKSGKMSASDTSSKIDLLDSEKDIKKKMNAAFCEEGVVKDNGVLAFCRYVLMTLKEDKKEIFTIKRPEKFGGDISYETYEALEKDFAAKKLHPMDLKQGLANELITLLEPIRNKIEKHPDLEKNFERVEKR